METTAALRVGPGTEPGVQIGPLIDAAAVEKVSAHVEDALRGGARLVAGGAALDGAGQFFAPTVLDGITSQTLIAREETFGPVAGVTSFTDEREVVALANDAPYGLAAYVHTRDYARLIRIAERLDFGVIGANDGAPSTPPRRSAASKPPATAARAAPPASTNTSTRSTSPSAASPTPTTEEPHMSSIDFSAYDALTFDCYGTLIDWETGILNGLRPVLAAHGVERDDEDLLQAYAGHEAKLEAGPYLTYREVLAASLRALGADLGFTPSDDELESFSRSVSDWPAFQDSGAALQQLKQRFRLGVITNCDDDLFADSTKRLGVEFDWIITAQQAQSYKPNLRGFELAFERIDVPRERILHVAQSVFHDHVPAKQLGMTTVWINRRAGREGFGATPPATAQPDLTVPDMRTFADLATRATAGP